MHKIAINDGWKFKKLADGNINDIPVSAIDEKNFVNVDLPHTWHADGAYRGLTLYSKTISTEPTWKHAFIDIPGADQHAVVLVNGKKVAEHKGAYSAFRARITEDMLGQDVRIDVYLTNKLDDGISPLTGDFTIFGGLYRGMNLLVTESDAYFDPTYYGTDGVIIRTGVDGDEGTLSAEIHAVMDDADKILIEIVDPDGNTISEISSDRVKELSTRIPDVKLWNGKEAQALYRVKASIWNNSEKLDEVALSTGFRSVSIDSEKGLCLNGNHFRVNGVAKHQDFAECYNVTSESNIEKDFSLIDEIGANAVRLSHYQHPQFAYDMADRKGYLVWAEIPMLKMTDNEDLKENAKEQLKELIMQNIHHPSIFCWGIQNEIGMFRDAAYMYVTLRELRDIAKELDPSRLVTAANLYTVKFRSELNSSTDMIGYNIYFGWYYGNMHDYDEYLDRFHKERPEVPIGVSEYGVDCNTKLHSEKPVVQDYTEEYQALYHETVYPIFESKDYLWGSFVWNMFDFSSDMRKDGGLLNLNGKGLVTYDRNTRKDAFYYYKAKWSSEKFVHICSKRFVNRNSNEADIKIYTNCDEVTLAVNEKVFGKRNNSGNGIVLFRSVPLQYGDNAIEVSCGDYSDSCVFRRSDTEDESYRLPNSGAGQAVKNWFLSENDFVKEGFFSIEDSANDLIENLEAREVLKKYLPELVELMLTKDVIPLGLSMQSILSRNTPEGLDILALNKELNQIKNDLV